MIDQQLGIHAEQLMQQFFIMPIFRFAQRTAGDISMVCIPACARRRADPCAYTPEIRDDGLARPSACR